VKLRSKDYSVESDNCQQHNRSHFDDHMILAIFHWMHELQH